MICHTGDPGGDAAPAAEAAAVPALTELLPHAASAKKSRTRSDHVDRNEYSPSRQHRNDYYQPSLLRRSCGYKMARTIKIAMCRPNCLKGSV